MPAQAAAGRHRAERHHRLRLTCCLVHERADDVAVEHLPARPARARSWPAHPPSPPTRGRRATVIVPDIHARRDRDERQNEDQQRQRAGPAARPRSPAPWPISHSRFEGADRGPRRGHRAPSVTQSRAVRPVPRWGCIRAEKTCSLLHRKISPPVAKQCRSGMRRRGREAGDRPCANSPIPPATPFKCDLAGPMFDGPV
jgi:hypothetical protein